MVSMLDMAKRSLEAAKINDALVLIDVTRATLSSSLTEAAQKDGYHNRCKPDQISPNSYRDIEKWASIQLYVSEVGQPVTFRELLEAMRRGGMQLPKDDGNAYRILSIVVRQNSGPDGKRNWPARFYREGFGNIDDVVGLLSWKQQEAKAG
jgi:hypothetical protein